MVAVETQNHLKSLVVEAITVMCKNVLSYKLNLNVEGLLGITLDNEDIFLININEAVQSHETSSVKRKVSGSTGLYSIPSTSETMERAKPNLSRKRPMSSPSNEFGIIKSLRRSPPASETYSDNESSSQVTSSDKLVAPITIPELHSNIPALPIIDSAELNLDKDSSGNWKESWNNTANAKKVSSTGGNQQDEGGDGGLAVGFISVEPKAQGAYDNMVLNYPPAESLSDLELDDGGSCDNSMFIKQELAMKQEPFVVYPEENPQSIPLHPISMLSNIHSTQSAASIAGINKFDDSEVLSSEDPQSLGNTESLRNEKRILRLFEAHLEHSQVEDSVWTCYSLDTLDKHLQTFWPNVLSKEGEQFRASSFEAYKNSLKRAIQKTHGVNIIRHTAFTESNKIFQEQLEILKKAKKDPKNPSRDLAAEGLDNADPSTLDSSTIKNRAPKKTLTLEDRVKVLMQVDMGHKSRIIAKMFDCGRTQIQKIIHDRENIMRLWNEGSNRNRKYLNHAKIKYPLIDEKMWNFYQETRAKNLPMSGSQLKSQAKIFAAETGDGNFEGSNGWLDSFIRRHNIKLKEDSKLFKEEEFKHIQW